MCECAREMVCVNVPGKWLNIDVNVPGKWYVGLNIDVNVVCIMCQGNGM